MRNMEEEDWVGRRIRWGGGGLGGEEDKVGGGLGGEED